MENTQNGNDGTPQKQPKEVTKRSIRVETWEKFRENRCSPVPTPSFKVFNRVPNFEGAEKAAALLAETDEFKNAKTIKVNIDLGQEPVKLQAIQAGKTLYVPANRDSSALFAQVVCPADADIATLRKAIRFQGPPESKAEVAFDSEVKLDMIVVGSCAVSKTGYRLGKGNGYIDLDVGILKHLGVITDKTVIVTTVHDVQVYDNLPQELFQKYDLPLDLIVTPTEVIRVEKRLPRSSNIQWELLSKRRLGIVPVLKLIKEKEEEEGKVIVLKEDDTDVETNRKPKFPHVRYLRQKKRRQRPSSNNDENTENENGRKNQENGNGNSNTRPPRRRGQFRRNRRQNPDQAGGGGGNGSEQATNNKENEFGGRHRNRQDRDLCIKVTNISCDVKIKDLKAELRNRGCNPTFISYKRGTYGRCFLYFPKKINVDEDDASKELLAALSNLSLQVQDGDEVKDVSLNCEFVKRKGQETNQENSRIETTDVTSV